MTQLIAQFMGHSNLRGHHGKSSKLMCGGLRVHLTNLNPSYCSLQSLLTLDRNKSLGAGQVLSAAVSFFRGFNSKKVL